MESRIAILIGNKDRPTELSLLLQGLRTQTYQNFDIFILDDCSGTPITNYYFINYLLQRLKIEGHMIRLKRNNFSNGVSKMRQQMIDWALKEAFDSAAEFTANVSEKAEIGNAAYKGRK